MSSTALIFPAATRHTAMSRPSRVSRIGFAPTSELRHTRYHWFSSPVARISSAVITELSGLDSISVAESLELGGERLGGPALAARRGHSERVESRCERVEVVGAVFEQLLERVAEAVFVGFVVHGGEGRCGLYTIRTHNTDERTT